jgi:hypothetical protein
MGPLQELGLELVELVFELFDGQVHGREPVWRRNLAANVMPVTDEGDFAHLFVGGFSRVLFGEMHLSSVHTFEESSEPADLVDGALSEQLRDLGVAAADGDLHARPLRSGCWG